MGYNVHDVWKKECEILIFDDDLKFDHFLRWNIIFVRNLHTFKNSYLFNNDYKKKWCIGEHLNIF